MKKFVGILLLTACLFGTFACMPRDNTGEKDTGTELETTLETEIETEINFETEAITDTETDTETDSETDISTETESCTAADTDADTETESDTEITTESETKHVCDFSVELPEDKYLKLSATCKRKAKYYYSCTCGKMGEETFTYGEMLPHDFSVRFATGKHLKQEATLDAPAVYYYSCKCGETGTETFEYGDKLTEQVLYMTTSLTVTLYDAKNSIYGFTFNSYEPLDYPCILFKSPDDEEWMDEYRPREEEAIAYDANDQKFTYYVYKVEVELEPDTTYIYCVGDESIELLTQEATLKTKNPDATNFTFVHVSDSQKGPSEFRRVLKSVSGRTDFIIHTGDVVQDTIYEYQWTEMLANNFSYLSSIPIMAISGNHEVAYTNCSNETYEHFNNKLPSQSSTTKGYFYSFEYGDVKFIMLNTNDLTSKKLKDEQYNWLIGELQNNTCKWTVVSMHNPLYSVGKYGVSSSYNSVALSLQTQLQGIFARYGVDIVLQGHDHAISRTHALDKDGKVTAESFETVNGIEYTVDPSGVIYLMNGPAGAQNRAPDDAVGPYTDLYHYYGTGNKASWAEFDVTEDTITVTVKYHDGSSEKTYYTWGIKKS